MTCIASHRTGKIWVQTMNFMMLRLFTDRLLRHMADFMTSGLREVWDMDMDMDMDMVGTHVHVHGTSLRDTGEVSVTVT